MAIVQVATFELKMEKSPDELLASFHRSLTLLPLVIEAVITEAVLGGAGAPSSGGAAGGHPDNEHVVTIS